MEHNYIICKDCKQRIDIGKCVWKNYTKVLEDVLFQHREHDIIFTDDLHDLRERFPEYKEVTKWKK